MKRAVVTGASGFLGRAFSTGLRDAGYDVDGIDVVAGPDVTRGDVTRPGSWTALLEGAELVVHTAAVVRESGDETHAWDVNVGGTRTVLEAAAEAGVTRALHLSSIVVYGPDIPPHATETDPVRMSGEMYTDTKVAAEHQALRVAANGHLPVTVIRVGDVFGPSASVWTVRTLDLLTRNLLVLPDGGRGVMNPVYVDDVVEGGIAAATEPEGVGQIFNLTMGRGILARDFFRPYADALGVPLRTAPRGLARAAAGLLAGAHRLVGRTPPVSSSAIEYVGHSGVCSIDRARRVLGWAPRVGFDDGMERTLRWATEAGLLSGP